MKTMKQTTGVPVRVKESEVAGYLARGYSYCPKSEWKEKVRDVAAKAKAEKKEKTTKSKEKKKNK
jgi:hypothetical protein